MLSTLQPGCDILDENGKPTGKRQLPINCILCNFTKPTEDKPSLLFHNEVETLFHEFGHGMHNICSRTMLSRFHGTRVERDFVECPSQMLEQWCWTEQSLNMMSGHYADTSKKIPPEPLKSLINSKRATSGLLTKRQLVFGILDQRMHTSTSADTEKLMTEVHAEVMGMTATPDTNFVAGFGHLAGGYDSSYYGYLWAEVFSADAFYTKFEKNLLSPEAGMEYRKKILEPGGSVDAIDLLKGYLGREPTMDGFLKDKGLTTTA